MQLAVKSAGSIVIQRTLAYSSERKCTKSGKEKRCFNGSKIVISIFEENSIKIFTWLFCFPKYLIPLLLNRSLNNLIRTNLVLSLSHLSCQGPSAAFGLVWLFCIRTYVVLSPTCMCKPCRGPSSTLGNNTKCYIWCWSRWQRVTHQIEGTACDI